MRPMVSVHPEGRGGTIKYVGNGTVFTLSFEYTYNPGICYMIILIPPKNSWQKETGLPAAQLEDILHYIADEIISAYAPSYTSVFYRDFIEIVRR